MEAKTSENELMQESAAPVFSKELVPAAEEPPKVKIPKHKKKRRWLKVLIVLVVIGAAGAGWVIHARSGHKDQVSSDYLVEKAGRRDLTVSVSGTATLEPADSYNVTSLVSGEILSAPFEEGDLVEKGSLLYSIDASSAQNTASSASIGVEQAKMNYQQILNSMSPTATQAGTIDEIFVKNGESVAAGAALCRILTSTDLYVDFLYDADVAKSFYVGESAALYINGFEGSTSGTVLSISSASFVTSTARKMCTVRVKISNPGMMTENQTGYAMIAGNASYGTTPINYAGTTTMYAAASGTVSKLTKLAGSRVAQGEVLCNISSDALRDQLKSAQLAIETARLSAATAQDSMGNYTIKSPISGTIIEKKFKAGDKLDNTSAAAAGPLAVVYDLSYLKMDMNVDELDISKVKVGQKVEITADALIGQSFSGTVDKVSINGTTANGVTTYPVTITIREYGSLLPGMNVSAKILGETVKDALCIPLDAVSRGNVVLVPGAGAMNADNTGVVDVSKVEEKEISLGRNDEEYIEVTSGLAPGDIVLVQNQASNAMASMMGG